MKEILFLVEDTPDGGYSARALGEPIFSQGETMEDLRDRLSDAVRCHFPDERTRPRVIRLHLIRSPLNPFGHEDETPHNGRPWGSAVC